MLSQQTVNKQLSSVFKNALASAFLELILKESVKNITIDEILQLKFPNLIANRNIVHTLEDKITRIKDVSNIYEGNVFDAAKLAISKYNFENTMINNLLEKNKNSKVLSLAEIYDYDRKNQLNALRNSIGVKYIKNIYYLLCPNVFIYYLLCPDVFIYYLLCPDVFIDTRESLCKKNTRKS